MTKEPYQRGGERVIPAIRVPDAIYDSLVEMAQEESRLAGKKVPMSAVVRRILINALEIPERKISSSRKQ